MAYNDLMALTDEADQGRTRRLDHLLLLIGIIPQGVAAQGDYNSLHITVEHADIRIFAGSQRSDLMAAVGRAG